LDNLNDSYGHVLDLAIPHETLRPDQVLADVAIDGPNSIKHLIGWNEGLMKPTLQFAKSRLELHPGVVLRHNYSTADKSNFASIPNGPRKLIVDHIIALDDFPGPNLVVGLGRPSSKWSGRKLANQLDNASMELLWPLRQLANICRIAQTRYGYIQTDEELVTCCFSKAAEKWKVAIMPIPWSRYGVDVLTTDLALWWLCMLAMSARHHRAIVEEGEMVKIDDWDLVFLGEERWVLRHRYSNFEKPTNPPSPPAYQTPSPGNAASFAAAVGLLADDQFNIEDPDAAGRVDPNAVHIDAYLNDPNLTNFEPDGLDFDLV